LVLPFTAVQNSGADACLSTSGKGRRAFDFLSLVGDSATSE
jgi:hypothetical protein